MAAVPELVGGDVRIWPSCRRGRDGWSMAEPFILKDNLGLCVSGLCCGAGSELSFSQLLGPHRTLTSAILLQASDLQVAFVADSWYRLSVCVHL